MQDIVRRRLLGTAVSVAGGLSLGLSPAVFAKSKSEKRSLFLKNMHTSEKLDLVYWENGAYIPEATHAIDQLLRDHRRNESRDMDTDLLDLLHLLHATVDAPYGIEVFSGYRSPKTNAALAAKNSGVAKKSLHMKGQAADIRIPGVKLSNIRKAALSLKLGGVGYYRKSGFLHVDTGRVRQWG